MSILAIVIDDPTIRPATLIKLHKFLMLPLQKVKSLCTGGNPILEIQLFDGDLQETSTFVRGVLKIISEEKISAKFYEIPYGERYADNRNLEKREVTADLVNSILNAADEEFERQQDGQS